MVEILKSGNSNNVVIPTILSQKAVPGHTRVELRVYQDKEDKKEGIIEILSRSLNINLFLYMCSVVFACALFTPQVRGFFSEIGMRWAHILCLSFALSFCSNPVFAWLAKKLNILDIPDTRKLHKQATPLLGGAAVFIGFGVAIINISHPVRSTGAIQNSLGRCRFAGINMSDDSDVPDRFH